MPELRMDTVDNSTIDRQRARLMDVASVPRSFFSLEDLIRDPALAAQISREYEHLDKLMGKGRNRPQPAPPVRRRPQPPQPDTELDHCRRRLAALTAPTPAPSGVTSAPANDMEMARQRLNQLGYRP